MSCTTNDPVDAIFALHGVPGPWDRLPATGVANRIYATRDVVLRVATDHPDAVVDARTESVAAPAAWKAGILTPRLIAFDDSRTLVDRPYSLWERVHGETVGLADLTARQHEDVWRRVGTEIAHLHTRVLSCSDPSGYLDTPGRELKLEVTLQLLAGSGNAKASVIADVERLIRELRPYVDECGAASVFVHNDLHEMNIMCSSGGELLAILDWGDAGWGDPALDFAAVPLDVLSFALEGYGPEGAKRLGRFPEARFVWDRLHNALDDAIEDPAYDVPVAAYRRFFDRTRYSTTE